MTESSNPYQSPDSKIYLKQNKKQSKNIWKAFFVVSTLLYIISLFFLIELIIDDPLVTIIELIIDTAVLLGIFGFAFDKKIAFKGVWIVLLISALGIESYDYIENGFLVSDADGLFLYFFIFSLLILVISLLQYLAVYLYGFKSEDIWSKNSS